MTLNIAAPMPLSVEQIDADWLSAALALRYPGTEVTRLAVIDVNHGTASKLRLDLQYNRAGQEHGLPGRLVVKGGFAGPQQRALACDGYRREARFYEQVSPSAPAGLERPQHFFAGSDPDNGQSIVLLEDLAARNASFGRATAPVSVATAAATLEWLARFHAHRWTAAVLQAAEPYPGIIKAVIDVLLGPDMWDVNLARPLARFVPAALRDPARVRRALQAMWQAAAGLSPTLIHGDAHLGNMYFLADGAPGFLDWQSPMIGPPMDDVTYFLIGALSIADRRAHERELLRHYLEQLVAAGAAAPSFDAAWLTYRQQVMHGFMWVATPPQMQPDDIVEANTERFSAAAEDLESLRALAA